MDTMHLMDADAKEEKALCKATVETLDLTSVQDYVERRMNDLPMSPVCPGCKILAAPWADSYCLGLEAEADDLMVKTESLGKMAENCRVKAESLRRQAEEAANDAVRYHNSAGEKELEADRLWNEAHEYREVVEQLVRENRLDGERG